LVTNVGFYLLADFYGEQNLQKDRRLGD